MTGWGGPRTGAGRKKGSAASSSTVMEPKQRGGARPDSGRKPGSGKYGEQTKTVRIPVSMQNDVANFVEHKGFNLPVFAMAVPMGPLKDSVDLVDRMFNMNELIRHPDKTFFHPVEGDSMEPTVFAGDLAMIDAAVEPMNGDVVLASVDGGLTLKRLRKTPNRVWLDADNKKYEPIYLDPELENIICGVMLISIRPISTNHMRAF